MPRTRLALPFIVLALACARETGTPLATLEGRTLTEADFQRHLARTLPADEASQIRQARARRQEALEQWFDELAVASRARRLGIDKQPNFVKAVELAEMKALAHLVTERQRGRIEGIARVAPEEVRSFYEEHKGEYTTMPSFTAHHLVVYVRGNPAFPERGLSDRQARAKARLALEQLRAGQGWDVVARRYSDDLSNQAGLIRQGQFGFFAPEVERAVRTQALGKPGDPVKSVFGYHVLQVESRIVDSTPKPFAEVEPLLRQRLSESRASLVHKTIIEPIAQEVGLRVSDAGRRDLPLLDESALAPDEILAEVSGRKIRESDFRWFLKDALVAGQRPAVYSRPHARQEMLGAFLDMLVLQAKARKQGLDKTPDFARERARLEQSLLLEFLQASDKFGPFCQCQPQERQKVNRRTLARLRSEAGLRILADPASHLPRGP